MKKTVLALAALAASSAAFAQSSVTLYGVVDASVESVTGSHSLTRVSSDNLATTRIGFKGVEDLGGGLKANFVLESAVKSDTGAFGDTNRAFSRAAWVGLSGGFGEVRLGRQDSLIGAQIANTIGAQAYDESVVAQTLGGSSSAYRRLDNAVTYFAPKFVQGLTLGVQYTTAADQIGATKNSETGLHQPVGRGFGLVAEYANGPLGAGLSYIAIKAANGADLTGKADNTAVYAYGSYDFGLAKVTGYYDQDKQDVAQRDRRQVYGVKVAVPVVTNVTVTPGFAYVRNATTAAGTFSSGVDNDNAKILTLKAQYDLSKRTALYGLYTAVYNDNNTNLGLSGVTTTAGKGARGIAVGVRHAF